MFRNRTIACGLLLALTVSAVTLAQSDKPIPREAPPDPPPVVLVTMKFPGGTVADYIAALKKSAGNVNIIAATETSEVPMPPVELTNASLDSAMHVLDGRTAQLPDRVIRLKLREQGSGNPNEVNVFAIDAQVQGQPVDNRIMQRVWSVKSILDGGANANDLLTAIQTSLDLLTDAAKPAQLKFHEATGLIIARASPDQIDAIQQVIEQSAPQQINAGAANKKIRELESENQRAHLGVENCLKENARLQLELAEAKKR